MIKIITKFYALSLVLFLPSFASSGIIERSDPTNFEINCDGQPKMLERFGPANFDFEINCNNKPIRKIKYRSDTPQPYQRQRPSTVLIWHSYSTTLSILLKL